MPAILRALPTDLEDILTECYKSTKAACKLLFPERFYLPFSSIHDQIFDLLDNSDNPLKAIAAPRGIGKTSILGVYAVKRALFKDSRFVVTLANSAQKAILQSENLKRELLANRDIRTLFGVKKTESFSKEEWVLGYRDESIESGTMVMPRGAGQQIRGISFGIYRPDTLLGDDIEDSEEVLNKEVRDKMFTWLNADVLNAPNRDRTNWVLTMAGTVLHEDSVLERLLNNKSWDSVRLSICDEGYKTFWPDFIPQKELDKIIQHHRQQHTLDIFAREYMNQPIARESAAFKQDYFKYYDEDSAKLATEKDFDSIIIVDPARTTKKDSALTAIICLGVHFPTDTIYVRDLICEHLSPLDTVERCFDLAARFNVRTIAVETSGIDDYVMWPMNNEMIRRRRFVNFIEMKTTAKKDDRILALTYFYRRGQVKHNSIVPIAELESELLSFPRSKRKDAMDAMAHVVTILEDRKRYFSYRSSFEGDPFDVESEYKVLEAEPALQWAQF